jgi:hypothetical protein
MTFQQRDDGITLEQIAYSKKVQGVAVLPGRLPGEASGMSRTAHRVCHAMTPGTGSSGGEPTAA